MNFFLSQTPILILQNLEFRLIKYHILNYIEPYNLDLRTVQCPKEHNNGVDAGGNLLSSRVTTLTTTSVLKTGSAFPILATTTTTVNSDISSNVTGSSNTAITCVCSNLFNKQLSTNGLQQTVIMSLTHPHSLSSSSCSTTTTTFTNINPLLSSQSDSSVFLKSNKILMSCNGTNNMTTVAATATSSANQLDDEHIEYREIDPISTNALAIVKERFG
ncbi:uncharacterized protein DC041_0002153 [Schistosoma bovis]|uniref:Uncharacterized protein n=1 Tax=Schistosoma bovis TaxID=6184 RepID=A0A430QTL0_SCHBO|nr:uncharacterized protein DC041_0002153 [Schistosoma bovis]